MIDVEAWLSFNHLRPKVAARQRGHVTAIAVHLGRLGIIKALDAMTETPLK